MDNKVTTGIGLFRDLVASVLAVAILFGANFTDDQIAGILLLVSTVAAFTAWTISNLVRKSP